MADASSRTALEEMVALVYLYRLRPPFQPTSLNLSMLHPTLALAIYTSHLSPLFGSGLPRHIA